MSERTKQIKEFLESCNATVDIQYIGLLSPLWDDKPHRAYNFTIKTPRGEMTDRFYDSLHNTDLFMDFKDYFEKHCPEQYESLTHQEKVKFQRELKAKREAATPTEYNILSCLELYDVGSMDDFMHDFGYEINCVKDMLNLVNTYHAVVEQYNNVHRCFTEEQIEKLEALLYA